MTEEAEKFLRRVHHRFREGENPAEEESTKPGAKGNAQDRCDGTADDPAFFHDELPR